MADQPETLKNFLTSTGFGGEGLRLVSGSDGALNQVVYGVITIDNPFLLGDMPNQSPAGDYYLKEENENTLLKTAAISWGLGAYRYTRYKQSNKTAVKSPVNGVEPVNRRWSYYGMG